MDIAELSQYEHVMHRVAFDGTYAEDTDCQPVTSVAEANGISSEIASGVHAGQHTVAIDLDIPARLIPSTTPGHSHLYIDAPMPWATYLRLLGALAEAGVIEQGYRDASARRGHTTLRLPWVKKGDDPIALDRRLHCSGCGKHPSEITAYDLFARDGEGKGVTNAEYVYREEGTLNRGNGRFYCDACYIAAGQPLGTAP